MNLLKQSIGRYPSIAVSYRSLLTHEMHNFGKDKPNAFAELHRVHDDPLEYFFSDLLVLTGNMTNSLDPMRGGKS
jgi:hypothetical protein